MSIRKLSRSIIVGIENPLITHATIVGRFVPCSNDDYMRLARLAWSFRRAVEQMVREVVNRVSMSDATKKLYHILPNYIYLESVYKHAKLVVEGCEKSGGDPKHIHIRKLFIISRGNKFDYGNRNIRLIPRENFFDVLIRYPWDASWIKARAFFGEKYIPVLRELSELASRRVEGYGVKVVFRNEGIEVHVSVPLWLYLKHFSKTKPVGYGLVAGVDLNSDRINMVVVDKGSRIVAVKNMHFHEVSLHGYPAAKASDMRLKKLKKLLTYAKNIGADYAVFENLFVVKNRTKTASPSANRKITRFVKRQLLVHSIIMALKLGLIPLLVDPRGTTTSEEHERVMKTRGLDKHTASAYLIALRGLGKLISNNINQYEN